MIERNVEVEKIGVKPVEAISPEQLHRALWPVALCTLAFIACILLIVAPLSRLPHNPIPLSITPGIWLANVGTWLPVDIGLTSDHQASRINTSYVEFIVLMLVAFAIYGLCAILLQKQVTRGSEIWQEQQARQARRFIWTGAAIAGVIFVLTPAMLSGDIIVYTSYSRVLVVHHANPYFIPLAAFPHDPYVPINYWAKTTAAYGPVWLAICAFWGLLNPILGSDPLRYVLIFRLFALAAHLINIWLVIAILHERGCSPLTVTLGALLYAWNPLVLLESSLGGHNDVFMVTFILLGIWFAACAERKNRLTQLRGYLPALIAFMLAALIKFTTLPLVILFIILLVWRKLLPTSPSLPSLRKALSNWQPALLTGITACIVSGVVALACYSPFWLHHSVHDIANSFSSPPSALFAENSMLRALQAWEHVYHPSHNVLLQALSLHQTWNTIDSAVLALSILIGAIWLWFRPHLSTFVLASLATLGGLLLVTPWFYSWYVTWLVGLAALWLPISSSIRHNRVGTSLLAFSLTFSFSALLTYLFKDGYPPFGIWIGPVFLLTIVPPICAFMVIWLSWRLIPLRKDEEKITHENL